MSILNNPFKHECSHNTKIVKIKLIGFIYSWASLRQHDRKRFSSVLLIPRTCEAINAIGITNLIMLKSL